MSISVLVADDHAIIRDGLRKILADTEDLVVAGEAADGNAALELVRSRDWDVVLMDLSMPGRHGIELIKLVKADRPKLPHTQLSDREFEVFGEIVRGTSLTDIAAKLSLSIKTVSTHKSNILAKMNLTSTVELFRYAVEHELLDLTRE